MINSKIQPNLWFNLNAEEAANYYVSIFKNSSIGRKSYFTEEGFEIHKQPAGTVMTIEFTLEDLRFVGLNGGPLFKFSEAVSFIVSCKTQDEIDYYWEKLGAGGDPNAQQCGWIKDKFGLSWQIVPEALDEMMLDPDKAKASRAMAAMLKMKKLNIAELEKAFNG